MCAGKIAVQRLQPVQQIVQQACRRTADPDTAGQNPDRDVFCGKPRDSA